MIFVDNSYQQVRYFR